MRFYVLDINPEPWAMGELGIRRTKESKKLIPYVGQNPGLAAYQEAVKELLRDQNAIKVGGTVHLTFYFWKQLEAYTAASGRKVRKHKPDVTNLQKALEDACQGILYDNDTSTTYITSIMVQAGSHVRPAVIIGIEADAGLDLMAGLDAVALEQLRKLNENTQPDIHEGMKWGSDEQPF